MKITINPDFCKGCMFCVDICPREVFKESKDKLNKKGYKLAEVVHPEKCIECRKCEMICPDFAINVEEEDTDK